MVLIWLFSMVSIWFVFFGMVPLCWSGSSSAPFAFPTLRPCSVASSDLCIGCSIVLLFDLEALSHGYMLFFTVMDRVLFSFQASDQLLWFPILLIVFLIGCWIRYHFILLQDLCSVIVVEDLVFWCWRFVPFFAIKFSGSRFGQDLLICSLHTKCSMVYLFEVWVDFWFKMRMGW